MKKIRCEQLTEYRFISNLQAGPAAETAAFVVTQANQDQGYDSHLWLLEKGKVRQLTSGSESVYRWEDDSTLLFLSLRTEKDREALERGEERTVFWRLNIHQGEALRAFSIPYTVTDFQVIEAGKLLLTIRYDLRFSRMALLEGEQKAALLEEKRQEQDYQLVTETPFYADGAGFTNGLRTRLALWDEASQTVEFLTEETMMVAGSALKGDQLLYWGADFTQVREVRNGLYHLDLTQRTVRCLIEPGQLQLDFALWLENDALAAVSDGKRYGAGETPVLMRIRTDTAERMLWNDNRDTFGNAVGTDCAYGSSRMFLTDHDTLYAVMTIADHTPLFRFDAQGHREEVLPMQDGAIFGFDVQQNKAYLIAMDQMRLQEIYEADLESGSMKQLTHLNEATLADCYVARPQRIDFGQGPDPLWGWVLLPKDFDPQKRYPAILDIHGGPRAAYGPVFYHEMQLWASEGYFVLFCNVHGSDGRGDAFADLRGKFGTVDYDDFMTFTDAVLQRWPQIDPQHLAVTGGSYGGYMTNWIIGHTDRFACAVSQRSISNWVSENMVSDIGFSFGNDQVDATPWSDVGKIWNQSPLQFADRVTTPTLFIHSFEDYRCPIQEGMQMFNALLHHGVETRMCCFRQESHGLSRSGRPAHRIRRLQEISGWIDRYCKKEEE